MFHKTEIFNVKSTSYFEPKIRSVERGICPIPQPSPRDRTAPIITVILHIFHCTCAIKPYFYFQSKIWRRHRVPGPRFPQRRKFRLFEYI